MKPVLILMPVFHYQDLLSCGSHLKGFPDPPHSDQLRKYFGWDQNKEDRRPTCESVCHKRAKPRLWGSIFVYTAPFTPRHLHQGLHHHSNICTLNVNIYLPTMICPRDVADLFLGKTLSWRKFWARISENILLARFLPMAAISSSMSRTYHHPRYLDQNLHVNTSSTACQGRGNPWKLDQGLELVPCISIREGVINMIFKT